MQNIENKLNNFISFITGILSIFFGDFWFLFVFLFILNIVDNITGLLKARYLGIITSKKASFGIVKKILMWLLILISFGIGTVFYKIGKIIDINLSITLFIGWFVLAHCIINEVISILENIVALDKGYLVPSWLIKGLEVANKLINKNITNKIEYTEEMLDSTKNEKGGEKDKECKE